MNTNITQAKRNLSQRKCLYSICHMISITVQLDVLLTKHATNLVMLFHNKSLLHDHCSFHRHYRTFLPKIADGRITYNSVQLMGQTFVKIGILHYSKDSDRYICCVFATTEMLHNEDVVKHH